MLEAPVGGGGGVSACDEDLTLAVSYKIGGPGFGLGLVITSLGDD